MPRYLALDGDAPTVQLVAATLKGGTARLEAVVPWPDGGPITAENAESAGRRLRDLLKEQKIAPAPLLVCVGRDRVILKEIRHPAAAAHEEPALVAFQVRKELTEAAEEQVIDYVPLGAAAGGEKRAMTAVLRRDVLRTYRRFAEAAGLKLAGITPRPFASLAGVAQAVKAGEVPAADPADASIAVLTRGEKWGEFVIARNGQIIFARAITGPALTNDAMLLGEVRRNVAVHANQSPNQPIRAVYLAEPDSPHGLRERLQAALNVPVYAFEPLVGVAAPDGPRGAAAGCAGLLALRAATSELPINFQKPREPKPPRDPNRRVLILAGAGLAALVLGLGGYAYFKIHQKNQELARLYMNKSQTDRDITTLDPQLRKLKAIEDWQASEIVWLDELYELAYHMPEIDKMRVTQLTATTLDERGNTKNKHVAALSVRGLSGDDPRPLDKFMRELSSDAHYRVPPKTTKQARGLDRQRFAQEFSVKFDIEHRPPDRYAGLFTAAPPPKRPRGFEGMDFGGGMGGPQQ